MWRNAASVQNFKRESLLDSGNESTEEYMEPTFVGVTGSQRRMLMNEECSLKTWHFRVKRLISAALSDKTKNAEEKRKWIHEAHKDQYLTIRITPLKGDMIAIITNGMIYILLLLEKNTKEIDLRYQARVPKQVYSDSWRMTFTYFWAQRMMESYCAVCHIERCLPLVVGFWEQVAFLEWPHLKPLASLHGRQQQFKGEKY